MSKRITVEIEVEAREEEEEEESACLACKYTQKFTIDKQWGKDI